MTEMEYPSSRILRERFRSSPRFGHTNSFSSLFSQDQEEFDDYIVGLLVTSLMILSFFLFWGFMLLLFAWCFGKKRVGFLSGAPFERTTQNGKANPWIEEGRIAFGVSCVLFIVFVITLVTAGIGNLNTTATTIGFGATLGDDYFFDLQTLLGDVLETAGIIRQLKDQFIAELRLFFSALKQVEEAFVADTVNITASVENLLDSLANLKDFLSDPLEDINATLSDGRETCEMVYDTTEKVDLKGLQVSLGLILTFLPLMLLGCLCWNVYGAKPNEFISKCRTWILLPSFVLLVVASVAMCCLVSIAGLLNGDFCNGGEDSTPESTIIEIFDKQGKNPNSFEYQATVYLIRNCDFSAIVKEYPLVDVEVFLDDTIDTDVAASNTTDQIDFAGIPFLINATNYNATIIDNLIDEFEPRLRQLGKATGNFLAGVACEPLYEVYKTVTHEAACRDSYKGVFWIFLSLLLMSLFGLLAITFRSALYPVVDRADETEDGANGEDISNEVKASPFGVDTDATDSIYPGNDQESFEDEKDRTDRENAWKRMHDDPPSRLKQIDEELFRPKSQRKKHGANQQVDDLYWT